jgi:hypothetical protein
LPDDPGVVAALAGRVRETWLEAEQGAGYRAAMTPINPFKYFKTSAEIIRLAVIMFRRADDYATDATDLVLAPSLSADPGGHAHSGHG